jgi:hypothetical protein
MSSIHAIYISNMHACLLNLTLLCSQARCTYLYIELYYVRVCVLTHSFQNLRVSHTRYIHKTCLKQNLRVSEHFSPEASFLFNQGVL